jgi:hypothetical protein
MTHNIPSNSDDIINSCDVIARIEQLKSYVRDCDECGGSGEVMPDNDEQGNQPEKEDCPSCVGRGIHIDPDDIEALRAQLERMARLLAKELGRPIALDYYNPGDSKTPWMVVEPHENGVISTSTFGGKRLSATACYAAMEMAFYCVRLSKEKH